MHYLDVKASAVMLLPGAAQDRCGYGPRIPLLVISPYAKVNFVDHSITDLSSILRFIEDNWGLGRIGNQSFDVKAGLINNMFDLNTSGHPGKLLRSDYWNAKFYCSEITQHFLIFSHLQSASEEPGSTHNYTG